MTAVLIGFADALAAPETAWSLVDAGYAVTVVARRGRRAALRRSRLVEVIDVTPPEQDAAATVAEVGHLLATRPFVTFLALDDPALWVADRLGVASPGAAVALDKAEQLRYAEKAGLAVPPTMLLDPGDPLPGDLPLPAVVKPVAAVAAVGAVPASRAVGGGGGGAGGTGGEAGGDLRLVRDGVATCADPAGVEAARVAVHGPVLVQPRLRGRGEGLFGHVTPGGVVAWSAHRRVRMMHPAGSGASACESAEPDPALLGPAERFLRLIGWRGMAMLEFLRAEDGTPWFLELNGRAWGSMALAVRRGFAYPAWTVGSVLAPAFVPDPPPDPPPLRCRHLGRELVHLAFALRGPRSGAVEWPARRRALADVLRVRGGDRWYDRRPGEAAVFWASAVGALASQVRR